MNKKVSRAGKYMSLLLRHTPEKEHLDMDRFGYVPVKQLLKRLDITMSDLEDIVKENNKKKKIDEEPNIIPVTNVGGEEYILGGDTLKKDIYHLVMVVIKQMVNVKELFILVNQHNLWHLGMSQ